MQKIFFVIIFSLFFCDSAIAENSDFIRHVWAGELTLDGLNILKEKLRTNPDLKEIEFRNSPGAGALAGVIINEVEILINRGKLKIFARGQCASACAFIFLMGTERTFLRSLNNVPTHLMLHAERNAKTGEINYGETDRFLKKIKMASNGKLPLSILEKIYDVKNRNGGIFITREPLKTATGSASVFLCSGEEASLKQACKSFDGLKPENVGILIAD